jgi:hypothetical protein
MITTYRSLVEKLCGRHYFGSREDSRLRDGLIWLRIRTSEEKKKIRKFRVSKETENFLNG